MLLQTLQSLQEQRLSGFEILVVDNAASLEVAGMVAEFDQTAKVASRYVSEPRLGLHYARHTGARHAHNQILAFIDDDAIADPGWLEGLLDGLGVDGVRGVVAGQADIADNLIQGDPDVLLQVGLGLATHIGLLGEVVDHEDRHEHEGEEGERDQGLEQGEARPASTCFLPGRFAPHTCAPA